MLTTNAFLDLYPEFRSAPSGLVSGHLAQQELLVGDSWGARENLYHGLITAEALAQSPYGRSAKLLDKQGNSHWTEQIKKMQRSNGFARYVIA